MAEVVTPLPALLPQQLGLCHTSSRAALHDSTNTSVRSGKRSIGHVQPCSTKRVTFPTSFARLHESNPRCRKFSASPPRFPVAYKALPTVSISFSAACSQNRGFGFEATELELPDVCNVVPFPCSPSDDDEDVEMSDGTLCARPPSSQPPARRKRRSACSYSSSLGPSRRDKSSKDPKDGSARKRPRKSKRHGADTWWLGVIHRSILQGLCEPEPDVATWLTNACDDNRHYQQARHNTFEAQDRLLAERIRQKLLDSGCHSVAMTEGRRTAAPLPSRLTLPPTLTPSVLMPSPILSSPAPAVQCRTEPENLSVTFSSSNEVTVFQFPRPPYPAGKVLFYPKPSTPIAIPSLQNLHDDFPLTPPPSPEDRPVLLGSKFRRSPSPPLLPPTPPRSRSTTPALQTATTLTMPQLVASLTLAHRERSGLRSRGRSLKSTSKCSSKSMGDGAYSTGEPASQESVCMEEDKEVFVISRSRGSQTSRPCADRRSPLCCVAYVENLQLSCPC